MKLQALKIALAGLLLSARMYASTTTVTGTLTGPGGDLLNGNCSIYATLSFLASDGNQVTTVPYTVSFKQGAVSWVLEPTTTGFPSTAAYVVQCVAPSQSVTTGGVKHTSQGSWGPWFLVVEPASTSLADVRRFSPPTPTLLTYLATVSGATTTVLATTHRLGTTPWLTGCTDSSGNAFQVTVERTDIGDVTITGTSATSGTCQLAGGGATWIYIVAMSGRSVVINAYTHNLVHPMLGACYANSGVDYEPGGYTLNLASDLVTITASAESPEFNGYCILQ